MTALYDPIMDALLALLKAGCGDTFSYYARGILQWDMLALKNDSGELTIRQPALFLYDGIGFGGGRVKYEPRGRGTPGVRIMDRTIVIYAQLPGAGTPEGQRAISRGGANSGGVILHPLIESVETVINTPDSEGTLTLGRLVSHCWIEGDAHLLTPDIEPNGQGMATLPIRIMVP